MARFYKNRGIATELIALDDKTHPLTSPKILYQKLLVKRTFRNVMRVQERMNGLSDEDIEKKFLEAGLSVRCLL